MDVTALLPRTDQLAAQLRRASPARVQAHRAGFAQLLDARRDHANAVPDVARGDTDAPARSRRAEYSDRPEDKRHRQMDFHRRADDEPRDGPSIGKPGYEAREASAPREGDPTASRSPRDARASADRREAGASQAEPTVTPAPDGAAAGPAATAATGTAEVPANVVMAAAEPPGAVLPAPAAAAAEKPATPASPAAPTRAADAAGVALAGAANDSTVPALVAPLAKPSAASTAGTETVAPPANAQPSDDADTGTMVNALVTALVGKTTARGQNQAMGTGPATGDPAAKVANAVTPATAQSAPEVTQPPNPLPAATPKAGPPADPSVAQSAELRAAAAEKTSHPALLLVAQEDGAAPLVRVSVSPRGDDLGFGKPSAPSGPAAATGGTVQPQANGALAMQGAQQSLEQANAAQAALSNAQAATAPAAQPATPPPAQAALAAGTAADPASMLDSGKGGFDPLAQVGSTSAGAGAASQTTGRTDAARMSRPPMPYAPVAEQVAVRIGKAIAEGADRIDIRLKPAALGSVRIAMELTHDGRVQAVVTADRADTLDMLKQDARSLERALHDAGLKADSNSLSFNLRGGDHRHPEPGNGGTEPRLAPDKNASPDTAGPVADAARDYVGRVGLLDIRV